MNIVIKTYEESLEKNLFREVIIYLDIKGEVNMREIIIDTEEDMIGYKLGRELYNKYLKEVEDGIIILPNKNISISFVKGFISNCKGNFLERFDIKGDEKVVMKFIKSIYY